MFEALRSCGGVRGERLLVDGGGEGQAGPAAVEGDLGREERRGVRRAVG